MCQDIQDLKTWGFPSCGIFYWICYLQLIWFCDYKSFYWCFYLLQMYFLKWRCPPITVWLCWSWMASALAQRRMKPRNKSCKLNWVSLRPRLISSQATDSPWLALMTLQRYVGVRAGKRTFGPKRVRKKPSWADCIWGKDKTQTECCSELKLICLYTCDELARCSVSPACYWSFWCGNKHVGNKNQVEISVFERTLAFHGAWDDLTVKCLLEYFGWMVWD